MKGSASITAEGIALIRERESEKPSGERICYDPYAHFFTSPLMKLLMRFFIGIGYADRRGPGVSDYLVARTRYIDDYLTSCIENGIKQLVILGAGYDSRAYRFPALKNVKVFEVDHPATQRVKMEKLLKIFGKVPEHVTFVPVDFETQTLAQRLLESGYSPSLRTLFIWEGVVYYLRSEAIEDTLAFIRENSGMESSVVFDYTFTSVIEGTYKRGEVASMKRSSRFTGEKMVFGFEEGKIEEYLERRGFDHIVNVTATDLKRMYFTGVNAKREVAPAYAIVHATLKPTSD